MDRSEVLFKFGTHPKFANHFEKCKRKYIKGDKDLLLGEKITLAQLYNPLHPEVYVVPKDRYLNVVEDEFGETIGIARIKLPFSSTDFYIDEEKQGLFYELISNEAFFRLGGLSQLAYLIPPEERQERKVLSKKTRKLKVIYYVAPAFPHTRWEHSRLAAVLMELVLADNNFNGLIRNTAVLAAGCHDIAIPAGGDAVIRIDRENLAEENNFSWVLKYYSLDKLWQEKFGFDLELAGSWVRGKGMMGKLLEVIDKISYTALDCYHLGIQKSGKIRSFCIQCPLVLDLWQDIKFSQDKQDFYFTSQERLFNFLRLRALEHQELLYNPRSRALDFFLTKKVGALYRQGLIAKEDLLLNNNQWLESLLGRFYPSDFHTHITPDYLGWRKFNSKPEAEKFISKIGKSFDHFEEVISLKTGCDWPVLKKDKIMPIAEVFSQGKINYLESIYNRLKGYYVYYLKNIDLSPLI